MDISSMNTPLYWQIPLGLLALVLAIFFVWLAFRISKTLKSVESLLDKSIPSLLQATEHLVGVHRDVSTLLTSLDGTVTELNQKLPQLLTNINGIAASLQQISESEIQPITHNIQETTAIVNQNIAKIDEVVKTIESFSQTTIKHVEYYRDQLSVPITDFISAWNAVKTGWEAFRSSRRWNVSDSEDIDQTEQNG